MSQFTMYVNMLEKNRLTRRLFRNYLPGISKILKLTVSMNFIYQVFFKIIEVVSFNSYGVPCQTFLYLDTFIV